MFGFKMVIDKTPRARKFAAQPLCHEALTQPSDQVIVPSISAVVCTAKEMVRFRKM